MSELPPELADLGDNPEIGVGAFHALRESGAAFQLLDIRDDWERAIGSLVQQRQVVPVHNEINNVAIVGAALNCYERAILR